MRTQGSGVTTRAPATWKQWVDAYTNLYSPPNRVAILARAIAELKFKDHHTVDSYALEVSKAHSRFYAEAARVTPHGREDPISFAREVSQTAAFEAGLPPHIRLEIIREDPTHSFQVARARAKKHETNYLRETTTQISEPAHVSSASDQTTSQLAETVADQGQQIERLLNDKRWAGADRGRSRKRSSYPGDRNGPSPNPTEIGKRSRSESGSRKQSNKQTGKKDRCTYKPCR